MYVYLDIVELYHVGNSQISIMWFLPITAYFQKMDIKDSIRLCMLRSRNDYK